MHSIRWKKFSASQHIVQRYKAHIHRGHTWIRIFKRAVASKHKGFPEGLRSRASCILVAGKKKVRRKFPAKKDNHREVIEEPLPQVTSERAGREEGISMSRIPGIVYSECNINQTWKCDWETGLLLENTHWLEVGRKTLRFACNNFWIFFLPSPRFLSRHFLILYTVVIMLHIAFIIYDVEGRVSEV